MVSLGNPDIINNESQKKQQMPESGCWCRDGAAALEKLPTV